jgi:penicillin-binding protein 1A
MKIALSKSYKLAAVHQLEQVGIKAGAQMVRRFGNTNPKAPSLPSAHGASEASLLDMTAPNNAIPNKGVRVQPHLIRKVFSRDGTLLEEFDGTSSRVTSEYVALTMVDLMRGVTAGGGTAAGAAAAGQPVAGKTGTVNDHTDVWFIGYTPTYVTGVWMGNPEKKENLGGGMTGGHGALPYFNAFMNVFMKDKPKESFQSPPPIPAEIRTLIERNKREEREKLEKANQAAIRSGAATAATLPATVTSTDSPAITTGSDAGAPPAGSDTVKPPINDNPAPVSRPPASKPPAREPAPSDNDRPEGTRRKGKKGDN